MVGAQKVGPTIAKTDTSVDRKEEVKKHTAFAGREHGGGGGLGGLIGLVKPLLGMIKKGFALVMTGIGWVLSKLKGGIGRIGKGIGNASKGVGEGLGRAMKFIPGVGLVAATAMAGMDAYEGWGQAEQRFGPNAGVKEKTASAAGNVLSGLTFGLLDAEKTARGLNSGMSLMGDAFSGLVKVGSAGVSAYGALFKMGKDKMVQGITSVSDATGRGVKAIGTGLDNVSKMFATGLKGTMDFMSKGLKSIGDGMTSMATSAWGTVKNIGSSIASGTMNAVKAVGTGASNVYNAVGAGVGYVQQKAGEVWDGVKNGLNFIKSPGIDVSRVNGGFMNNFNSMASEYTQRTGKKLVVTSGYRDIAKQKQLWDAELAKNNGDVAKTRKFVAPPGSSKHNFGMALDVNKGDTRNINEAASMGLLAKYKMWRPMGHEDWHVEPLGSRSGGQAPAQAPTAVAGKTTAPKSSDNQPESESTPNEIKGGKKTRGTPKAVQPQGGAQLNARAQQTAQTSAKIDIPATPSESQSATKTAVLTKGNRSSSGNSKHTSIKDFDQGVNILTKQHLKG
jgi:hypothetical protein